MRKYTKPSDKIKNYPKKYNVSEEEVREILSANFMDNVLTADQLRIKFDEPRIGTLPDWLTEEGLSNMIWRSIHTCYKKYNQYLPSWLTKEDIYMQIQIDIRTLVWQTHNFKDLKCAITNDFITIYQQYGWRSKYHGASLDTPVDRKQDEGNNSTLGATIHRDEDGVEKTEEMLVLNVLQIRDEDVRNAIICIAYLYCNIEAFREAYLDLLKSCDEKIQLNLKDIEEKIAINDEIELARLENKKPTHRKKSIKINTIIQALMIEGYEKANDFLEDLQSYILSYNLI